MGKEEPELSLHQLSYLFGESFRMLLRHRGIVLLSIMIMSLTLLILAVFLLATDNMSVLFDKTREDMKVYVYLRDDVGTQEVENQYKALLAMPEVEELAFVSKEEALEEFRAELGDDAFVLDVLGANPLPSSFQVTLKEAHHDKDGMAAFAAKVETMGPVEEVNYGRDFIERFSFITRVFKYIDLVLGVIVILSSIFIVSNTVRLTILSRRRSIEILKLVGATDSFITTPFVIEGAVQAAVAGITSLVLLFAIYVGISTMVPGVAFLSAERIVLFVGICIVLGAVGSFASLVRFMRL